MVGGFLRDALLGREGHDADVAVAGDPLSLGRQLADALGGHFDLVEFETREVEGVSGWPYQFWIVRRPRGLKLGAVGPSGP